MKQDANLENASNLATYARRHIETAFFSKEETPDKVIEIAFPFLENDKHIRRYLRNPDAFVVSSLRKRKVEISEKNLNPDEKELIRTAKGKEIKEFIKEAVVAKLKENEDVNPDDVMKMRWVLTWKKN
jgi:DNA topoisomerase IB